MSGHFFRTFLCRSCRPFYVCKHSSKRNRESSLSSRGWSVQSSPYGGLWGGSCSAFHLFPLPHGHRMTCAASSQSPSPSGYFSVYGPWVFISQNSCFQSCAATRNLSTSQARFFAATVESNRRCWACEHAIFSACGLFCSSCDAIQPRDPSVDYFSLLNIERSFEVDLKALEKRYKGLQKKLHPDLSINKSQKEQGYSAEQSAHVIQAYYTLLRPLSRAEYLLGLHGINIEEEGTIDDPDLLMEIMEIRESIEDISDAKDLWQLQSQNQSRIKECEKVLENTFLKGDLKRAVSWVQRLGYYIKVSEEIERKL